MNQQRIIELWDKANFLYYHSESDQPLPQFIFAELIVRECAGVCDDERDSTDSEFGKLVAEGCALKIMEHFGVEE